MKKLVIYYIIMYLNPVINNNSTRQHSFNIKKQASKYCLWLGNEMVLLHNSFHFDFRPKYYITSVKDTFSQISQNTGR